MTEKQIFKNFLVQKSLNMTTCEIIEKKKGWGGGAKANSWQLQGSTEHWPDTNLLDFFFYTDENRIKKKLYRNKRNKKEYIVSQSIKRDTKTSKLRFFKFANLNTHFPV